MADVKARVGAGGTAIRFVRNRRKATPLVEIAYHFGVAKDVTLSNAQLVKPESLVAEHRDALMEAWNDYFAN